MIPSELNTQEYVVEIVGFSYILIGMVKIKHNQGDNFYLFSCDSSLLPHEELNSYVNRWVFLIPFFAPS